MVIVFGEFRGYVENLLSLAGAPSYSDAGFSPRQ